MKTASRAVGLAAATLCGIGLLTGGCGGSEQKDERPAPPPSPTSAPPRAAPGLKVTGVHVTGGPLSQPARTRLTRQAAATVERWFRAAYVDGDYPRPARTFRAAFPGFTAGAAAAARKNLALMTNAGIATRIDTVKAGRQVMRLDVLAHKGHPVGVTARVWLVYGTSGPLVSRQVVRGQLNLAWQKGGWRVFAFDITRDRQQPKGGRS